MTYANGPGQRDLDGQVSHSRRAKASASVKAPPRGRNLTTFGDDAGPATVSMNLAQTEGRSVRTNAAISTSAGVASGTPCIAASPTDNAGKRGHGVVTESSQGSDPCTGLSRYARRSRKINWSAVAGLLALASPWIVAALIYHALRR